MLYCSYFNFFWNRIVETFIGTMKSWDILVVLIPVTAENTTLAFSEKKEERRFEVEK